MQITQWIIGQREWIIYEEIIDKKILALNEESKAIHYKKLIAKKNPAE